MISDPGFLTLFSSFIGAALFFCAGVFWNERPAPSRPAPQRPRRTHAPELFGVDASALSNSSDNLPALVVTPKAGQNVAAPARQTRPQAKVAPARPRKEEPTTLQALLEQLGGDLNASSISLLDPQGLLFSEGKDEEGAGARLCTMLSVKDDLPQDDKDLGEPQVFALGRLKLQRLPAELGPEAWLATVGAQRFAQAKELGSLDRLLAEEL